MKKTLTLLLKIISYSGVGILLFYLSFWLFFHLSNSFPSYFTTYSKNFNEESFQKIKFGTDRRVVDSMLGKPLRESINNVNSDSIKTVFWYTEERFYGSSYDKIFILFYDNKVNEIIRVIDRD
jgi:hypothetical protein